jgi:hypothetical protein
MMSDEDPFADLKPVKTNVVKFAPAGDDEGRFPPMEAYMDDSPGPEKGPDLKFTATAFQWRDPAGIPPRPWVYGQHMLRKQVSVTVAPGGVGKSSLTLVEALAMVTARPILGEWVPDVPLRVWVYNLEDPRDEMDRRVIGAMLHHNIHPEDVEGGLFLDTGRERGICTAVESKNGVMLVRPEIDALEAELKERKIDVLIIDPFISTHRVSENASGAIDMVAKEWAALADRCNCAIELVHHSRKTGGAEVTSEDGRGSSALLAAARSGRVLNKMSQEMREQAGLKEDDPTVFGVDRDKANLAPAGKRAWIRMVSVDLGQGDHVGVAESWQFPDAFDGVKREDLLAVQNQIAKRCDEGRPPRFDPRSGDDWVGHIIAEFLELDAQDDRRRITKILSDWIRSGALRKADLMDQHRKLRPCVEVGEWATE